MKVLAVLQARVSSSRLPGKVLKPLVGKPMILRQIERVRRAEAINQLVVATSTDPSDDPLVEACKAEGVAVYRGSLDDVLDRFYHAALEYKPEHVVRLTGDCPLADPTLIGEVIRVHIEGKYDYVSNGLNPTYPDGLDVEVMKFSTLEETWKNAKLESEREHVTPYIYKSGKFKLGGLENTTDLSHLRWTVDEPKDFELINTIYSELYPKNPAFTTIDVFGLLKRRPELQSFNGEFERNEGYQRSLRADRKKQ